MVVWEPSALGNGFAITLNTSEGFWLAGNNDVHDIVGGNVR